MSRIPGGEPAVRLEGIAKRLGWTWALRELDLEIERGSSVVLVGPNGAGKTTLLRLLATLLKPSAGAGEVMGIPLQRGADDIRGRVGLLSARGYLYGDLTAVENLQFAAWMGGTRTDGRSVRSALSRVGLDHVADRRAREFSSGMQKRLAFAALLTRPLELVLLDEPYASLDTDGIRMVDEFVGEWKRDGRTVLLATHRRGQAVSGADRVAVLQSGRLRRFCLPSELEPGDLDPEEPEPGRPESHAEAARG
ncbi:MAG: heme ABC exporter ATP-binding protein CcmA [Gemmatimonadota bacterium]|nr:MAG: heme ABC exporter ATP-binding protein CcmA [Gemmatimonadota bacterium]